MNDRRRLKKLTAAFGQQGEYYRILLHAEEAIKQKKHITRRLYRAVAEKLQETDLSLTDSALISYLSYQNRLAGFREEEILAVVPAVSLVILRTLSSLKDLSTEDAARLAEAAAATLRSFDTGNAEERYLALSSLEEHLRATDELYLLCDKATRQRRKAEITAFAKRHKIDEIDAADILKKRIPKTRARKAIRALYFLSIWVPALFLTLLPLAFGLSFWLIPFLFLPISELTKQVTELFFRRFLPPRHIPKLELKNIPDQARTAVVITTLLTKEDPAPFERLERFYLANKNENLHFGLLLDYADAATPFTERDRELSDFVRRKIESLNKRYGNRFFAAIRSRSRSATENTYMGRERKRGALLDFAALCQDKGDAFDLFTGDALFLRSCKYLITLDADTDLPLGTVKEMIGAMLHPENRPVIRHGRVVAGYAAMQPRMAVTAPSATATRFSLLLCGSGGLDVYSSATFDVYESLFGRGIFCGKGIFDLDVYEALLPDAFAPEEILSHDLLEGSLLRCAFLSDVVLTDSFPKTPLSFFTRLHRWYRGDVQALPYALPTCKKANGKRHKNPFGLLPRYQLLDNLRRLLIPVSAFLAIMLSMLFGAGQELLVFPFAVAYLFFPLITALCGVRKTTLRRYFSRILHSFWYTVLNLLFNLASLAHMAKISFDALFRSLWRMFVSRRHLLEWTTAAKADAKKNGAGAYLGSTLFSQVSGLIALVFGHSFPPRLFGIAWLMLPLVLVILAYEYPARPKPLSERKKAVLTGYVRDMWGYFRDYVTAEEHELPPDNLQLAPVKTLAHRTSPTNIGMYLLSCLAARDFGLIDSKELLQRTAATLNTLEQLPKKYGHLYNWYDTRTLEILGTPFISTVDSGNFVISLITLCQGLKDYTEEEPALQQVIFKAGRLAEEADFSALYCKERDLFYIARGNDPPSPLSCYDIFMSEARTTGYYAVAAGIVPKSHWEKLSRIVVGKGRYIGLASWSGTAFEYYMPHLFLPIIKNSMTYEALSFCSSLQSGQRFAGLWGISESAYYAFDADMNYQYKAHGIDAVALDSTAGRDRVVAPYAAFLQLARIPDAALSDLAALRDFGAYGDYGFFEAIDFTPASVGQGYALIKCFMSHHIGMSILASANAVFDNLFVRRFMSDPRMASAAELLDERIPVEAPLFRGKLIPQRPERPRRFVKPSVEKEVRGAVDQSRLPTPVLLSNGRAGWKLSSAGQAEIFVRNTLLSAPAFFAPGEPPILTSLRLVCEVDGVNYTLRPGSFSYSGTKAQFSMLCNGKEIGVAFGVHGEKDLFCLSFSAPEGTQATPTLVFQPLMLPERDWRASPFYADLSIEAFYTEKDEILFFRMRGRENRPEAWLGIGGEQILAFDSRKDLLPCPYTDDDLTALASRSLPGRDGAVVSPLAVMRTKPRFQNGKMRSDFLIAYGTSRSDVRESILGIRALCKSAKADSVSRVSSQNRSMLDFFCESLRPVVRGMLTTLGNDRPEARYSELYLSAITFPLRSAAEIHGPHSVRELWAVGISGDDPIIAIRPNPDTIEKNEKITRLFLKLHRLFREKGIRSELVFLCRERDSYNKPLTRQIGKLIAQEAGNGYIGRHGGIFLINDPGLFPLVSAAACLSLPIDRDTSPEELYYTVTRRKTFSQPIPLEKTTEKSGKEPPPGSLRLHGGWFSGHDFTVVKEETDGVRSFVYASSFFGTLVTANSPGYTWLKDSRECRLTEPAADLRRDISAERLLVSDGDVYYDVCSTADTVTFGPGGARYEACIAGQKITARIGIDPLLAVKLIEIEAPESWQVNYVVTPSCSSPMKFRHITHRTSESGCEEERTTGSHTVFWHNPLSLTMSDQQIFLTTLPASGKKRGFLFGATPWQNRRPYEFIRQKYPDAAALSVGFDAYEKHYTALFSSLRFQFPDRPLTAFSNFFLPYQAYVVRMLARAGYQQSGGAYGFRDQLQDCLAMLPYEPAIAKRQILRACAHQYEEGDVQHWWHPLGEQEGDPGLRTRISDDLLWLPYAVSLYVKITGDLSLLDTPVRYLHSSRLRPEETDRYETPTVSSDREGVYHHCMRAITASLNFSSDGLPLIGGGDWNDSFNRVGLAGRGTSVFLARFMQLVFHAFAQTAKQYGDEESSSFLHDKEVQLANAVEQNAWEDDRYLRARYDSGLPMGSALSGACAIDLLPQTFSALTEGATDRTVTAMNTAMTLLYNEEYKLLRLFTPPFPAERQEAGYVSAYCEGFRENGGQYTHGALFGVAGLFAIGENRRATSVLFGIAPTTRSLIPALASVYNAEPYFLCGDIYDNHEHRGRGGWGLYTGAAGWYLRLLTERLAGLSLDETGFTLSPALSDQCSFLTLHFVKKQASYRISMQLGQEDRCLLDGQAIPEETPHILFAPGQHTVEITRKKR